MPLTLQDVQARKDKIAKLSPPVREKVMDYLFKQVYGESKAWPNLDDEQKDQLKQAFYSSVVGRQVPAFQSTPTIPEGAPGALTRETSFGPLSRGVISGEADLAQSALTMMQGLPGFAPTNKPVDFSSPGGFIQTMINATREGFVKPSAEIGAKYTAENPIKSAASETVGNILPNLPGMSAAAELPVVGAGKGLLPRMAMNAPRNLAIASAGNIPGIMNDPRSAVSPINLGLSFLFPGGGKAKAAQGVAQKVAQPVERQATGELGQLLDKFAQDIHKQPYAELTDLEKAGVIQKMESERKNIQAAAEKAEKAAAEQAKAQEAITRNTERLKLRELSSKVVNAQRLFYRVNKRAPTEGETEALRKALSEGKSMEDIFGKEPLKKTSATVTPWSERPEKTVLAVKAEGKTIGTLSLTPMDDTLGKDTVEISTSKLNKEARGMLHGEEAYKQVIEYAKKQGKKAIYSDDQVSAAAKRVWEGLKKDFNVVEEKGRYKIDLTEAPKAPPEVPVTKVPAQTKGSNLAEEPKAQLQRTREQTKERVSAYRERQKAKMEASAALNPSGGSPEEHMIAFETASQAMKKLPNGDQMVNAIEAAAKKENMSPEQKLSLMQLAYESLTGKD
jgi:hypothetical protein